MGVEIKQLTVKSMVTSGDGAEASEKNGAMRDLDVELLKEQILDACRERIEQMFNDRRDR